MSSVRRGTRTVVHLLRHGEVHNPEGVLYGRMPGYRLSERGRQQALLVAQELSSHALTHVVSSPLERAQETAAPIAAAHRLDVATDERLIEADNQFEGLKVSVGDGALRQPRHWSKLHNPALPSWGEPYLEIAHRMLGAVHAARAAAEGHEALCVSHQLPVWTLRRYLEGRRLWHDPRRRQCSLASLTSLVFADEQLVDVVYTEPAGSTDPRVTGA
ncbi:histidine phosphatase family protein [Saccharomonospora piscinae]|uniref:histidine phosphatase family protein n=1 Tax=Saccharomonospora piscinae TaxID=687388 RepID=UPI0011065575|nr:histidine phosphatase family protein [Saccharomonospora piscinae]TLW93660.1 histidine phosphatase family protein [Saccharomonospora piscinae]